MRRTNRLIAAVVVLLLADSFAPWWWEPRGLSATKYGVSLWGGPSGWTGAVLVALAGCCLALGLGGRAGRMVAWGLPFGGGLVLLVDTLRWPKSSGMPSRIADYASGSAAETFGREYSIRAGAYVGLGLLALLTVVLRGVQRAARADTGTPFTLARPRPLGFALAVVTVSLLALSFRPWTHTFDAGWFSYTPTSVPFTIPYHDATAWQSSRWLAAALLLACAAVLAPALLSRSRTLLLGAPLAATVSVAITAWKCLGPQRYHLHRAGLQILTEGQFAQLRPFTWWSDAGLGLVVALAVLVLLRSLRDRKAPLLQAASGIVDALEPLPAVVAPPGTGAFLAIDSWAVRDGRVIGLDVHRFRFLTACADTTDPETVGAFFDRAVAEIPREGTWWPRVELGSDGELTSRLRPLPEPTGPLTVAVHQGDPRSFPRTKGPDLAVLSRLRVETTADEVLLTHTDGSVLEGATTSLLWWDGDDLCFPDPALPLLPGVTSQLIRRHARAEGVQCVPRRVLPEELDGKEVWLVNAVYGIRVVAAWTGTAITAGDAQRADEWQEWLAAQAEPLPSDRAADDA